jgi:phosphoenolpyruvate-protein kinase (PTS system EI component)
VRAIVAAGAEADLRLLLPMVEEPGQVQAVRDVVRAVAPGAAVALGAMVETGGAAERSAAIAAVSDFLSIGTNDLTHSVLATDRFAPGGSLSHDPAVVRAIAAIVEGGASAGRLVEVCGEAASSPVTMPLLLGLGVDELSVGAARVGAVRAWVRALRFGDVAALAQRALGMSTAAEVAELVSPASALLGELDDAAGERVDRGAGVVALGRQP